MARDKLLAEWFWCDRWMASDAFLLPLEARGLYREMLTQAWLRGGSLPKEPEAIRRACGVTVPEWRRAWPRVRKYWTSDGDRLVNATQIEVMETSKALSKARAKAGAKGRAKQLAKDGPQSPSQSPSKKPPNPRKRGDILLRRFKKGQKPPEGHLTWDAFFASEAVSQNVSAEVARDRWVAERESA